MILISIFLIYLMFSIDVTVNLYLILSIQIVFLRIFFRISWFHLIILLIFLEMFILMIFLLINLFFIINKLSIFFVFLFITLSVAEARIGLSILTILVRSHGNDYIKIIIF